MVRYENDCVGCPQGCIHCGRKHMPHCYCDECGCEIDYRSERWDADSDYHVCEECEPDEEEEDEE